MSVLKLNSVCLKSRKKKSVRLLKNSAKYKAQIAAQRDNSVYNLGKSAEVGAEYIIECVQDKIKERKKL